jgi:hypothetical protein
VPEGKTLNSEFYVKVVERLLKWCCNFERKIVGSFCTLMLLGIVPWWCSSSWWIVVWWSANQLFHLLFYIP